MAKKRPRPGKGGSTSELEPASKLEPAYWEGRLFKNTFTYKGRRMTVRGWSIKIQLQGRRKTFTVNSGNKAQAAIEAAQIYQSLLAHGWDGVTTARGSIAPSTPPNLKPTTDLPESDLADWKSRLIQRESPEPATAQTVRELSVRIEHQGISRYFPLGTDDESRAAREAMKIRQAVVSQGWAYANQRFRRELTLALRWLDSPLAWTYTTIHTKKSGDFALTSVSPIQAPAARLVSIIDPDVGIRYALAECVNKQDGFRCVAAYGGAAEALREISRQRMDLVLINYALPDGSGAVALEELQRIKPGLVGLLYSEFEDSDHLFKATPGGAMGYMLKRTPANRIFDPIGEAAGPLTRELVATKIREYFQKLIAALPSGPSAVATAKLTPREQEILALLAKGDLTKEIADSLGISIWTVQGHVKSIFEKLNVHTRTEAVVKFLQK